ncbi:hypothetical protein [Gemmata sp.]|uniref:hypothetical protein n=1 Tax=Gemmata sp. TaxID=1914242 RepID=UPI003F6F541F
MRFGRDSRGGFAPDCAIRTPGEEAANEDEDRDGGEGEDPEADSGADDGFDPDGSLRVQIVHAGRVCEFDPENLGDWYNMAAAAAVNLAVADGGRPERFLGIETGGQAAEFLFADPARFLPVARRLALPVRRDAVVE